MAKILEFLKNIKPVYRKILIGFAIILGIYALAIIAVVINSEYKRYKEKRAIQKWEETLRKPYEEDIYGGKTPEETWAVFLDALKKGDVELASKYFAVEKQKEMKNRFQESIKLDRFKDAIKKFSGELKKEETQIPNPEKAYYYIPIKNSTGEVEAYSVVFYLNPFTKIWKILVL